MLVLFSRRVVSGDPSSIDFLSFTFLANDWRLTDCLSLAAILSRASLQARDESLCGCGRGTAFCLIN